MTPRQRQLLQLLVEAQPTGIIPTYDEIRETLGLPTRSAVANAVAKLTALGFVTTRPGVKRSLTITVEGIAAASGELPPRELSDEQLAIAARQFCADRFADSDETRGWFLSGSMDRGQRVIETIAAFKFVAAWRLANCRTPAAAPMGVQS